MNPHVWLTIDTVLSWLRCVRLSPSFSTTIIKSFDIFLYIGAMKWCSATRVFFYGFNITFGVIYSMFFLYLVMLS